MCGKLVQLCVYVFACAYIPNIVYTVYPILIAFGLLLEDNEEGIRRDRREKERDNIRKFFLLFISHLIGLPVVNTLLRPLTGVIDEQEVSSTSLACSAP